MDLCLYSNAHYPLVNPTSGLPLQRVHLLPRSCKLWSAGLISFPINNGRINPKFTASYGGASVTTGAFRGNDNNSPASQAQKLRKLLSSPEIYQGPACFDALSAKLVERAGFEFCFTTGMLVPCHLLIFMHRSLFSTPSLIIMES